MYLITSRHVCSLKVCIVTGEYKLYLKVMLSTIVTVWSGICVHDHYFDKYLNIITYRDPQNQVGEKYTYIIEVVTAVINMYTMYMMPSKT